MDRVVSLPLPTFLSETPCLAVPRDANTAAELPLFLVERDIRDRLCIGGLSLPNVAPAECIGSGRLCGARSPVLALYGACCVAARKRINKC